MNQEDQVKQDRVKLAYCVSHPIQYQAPLLRRIAAVPGIDLTVYFCSDFSVRGYTDVGFGTRVEWDIPLLDGYKYEFLPKLLDAEDVYVTRPLNVGYLHRFLRERFDVMWVHGYHTLNNMNSILAAKLTGTKVLVRSDSTLIDRAREGWKQRAKAAYFAILGSMVDGVLVNGTRNAEYWSAMLPRVPQYLMPYAVDNEYFAQRAKEAEPTREALRAELDFSPERPVILFASKLIPRKRCGELLEAYLRLSPHGQDEPLPYLLIVGDGEERPQLEDRARETGWSSIHFAGFKNQSQMPRYFDLCDVFVLPSVQEPWGLIVNEVMAAGRAVIITDEVGCQPDLVADGVNGRVVKAGDIEALTQALQSVLAAPEIAQRMGEAGATKIAQWGLPQNIDGLCQAIEAVTSKHVRP